MTEQNSSGYGDNQSDSRVPPPPRPYPVPSAAPAAGQPPKKSSWLRRVLMAVVVLALIFSVLLNIWMGLLLAMTGMDHFRREVIRKGDDTQTVVVYDIEGIIDGKAVSDFTSFYRKVADDPDIKAVVLRVNSPGGGVSASDRIYNMVKKLRRRHGKTVVISMGGVAASGGYYVSAPGDKIYAEPTTVTGSIGVLSVWPVFGEAMEKYGVEMVTIRSSSSRHWKAAENFWEEPSERIRENVRSMLDKMQRQFESAVEECRGERLNPQKLEFTVTGDDGRTRTVTGTEPFNGKTFLADRAKELGLVDDIGYLKDATDAAAEIAKLTNPRVVRLVPRKPLLQQMGLFQSAGALESLDIDSPEKYLSPRILMLWKGE